MLENEDEDTHDSQMISQIIVRMQIDSNLAFSVVMQIEVEEIEKSEFEKSRSVEEWLDYFSM